MQNYSDRELHELGLEHGYEVAIHRSVIFFGAERIRIGDRVRIDCHCQLSAGPDGIHIGSNVHLAAGGYYFGSGAPIVIEDFAGLSSRVTIYTASDDFTEGWMTGPTVPAAYRKVTTGPVTVRKHVIVGAGTLILPGVTLGLAAAVGAHSLVNHDVEPFKVAFGNPARARGTRDRRILDLEAEYRRTLG